MGVPEVKPDHQWCPWCTPGWPGGGCSIYMARPERCRDFKCQWLIDHRFGNHWFPKTAKIVVDHRVEGENAVVCFIVDPAYPLRWREDPWFSDIKKLAEAGLAGSLGAKWVTVVLVKDERVVVGL
jgi:predicted pyridoxine 5'-phosphate oxidase superfamily flavin-nucleotide-binding protein